MVQETKWIADLKSEDMNFPGYVIAARQDRKTEFAGGGCAILVKNHIRFNSIHEKYINFECQVCSIKIKSVTFVCIYRRPHRNKEADKKIIAHLQREYSEKKIFLSGDLNLRDLDWDNETVTVDTTCPTLSAMKFRDAAWMEFMIMMDLEQLVRGPTHNLGGQLDVVICNKDEDIVVSKPDVNFNYFTGFTDHAIISTEVNIIVETTSKLKKIFDYKNTNWNDFNAMLLNMNIEERMKFAKSVNAKWIILRDAIIEVRFLVVPMKKVGYSANSPWVTEDLRILIRKDRRLRRNATKPRNNAGNKKIAQKKWAKNRAYVQRRIKSARYFYEKKVINSLQYDTNAVHKHFRKVKNSQISPPIANGSGSCDISDEEKCDVFQNHFMNAYNKDNPKKGFQWDENATLNDVTLSNHRLLKVVNKLKMSTSPGIDTIGNNIYKNCICLLSAPLLQLYSAVIKSGFMPIDWTISKVSPLYKGSGLKADLKRWRQLSLGCVALRILERMCEIDLRDHLERGEFLPGFQYGFRGKRSTVTNLLSSWNFVTSRLNVSQSTNILSLDGTTAFDLIRIPRLLEEISKMEIGGRLGRFLETYLIDRFQFVQIGTSTSFMASPTSGCPQGSVLGPLIFILASSPGLEKIVEEIGAKKLEIGSTSDFKLYSYADDLKWIFSLRDEKDEQIAVLLMEKLKEYSDQTGLKFNGSKSQLLRLGNDQYDCELSLVNDIIPETKILKDLGCLFSTTYTFCAMMANQVSKAKCVIFMIMNKLKARDQKSMTQLFQSYFQSVLLYASEVWLNLDYATLNKLDEIDQKFWNLAQDCEIRTFSSVQLAVMKNLMMLFKIKNKMAIAEFEDDFSESNISSTRAATNGGLQMPNIKLALKRNEFITVTSKVFNFLDPEIRKTKNLQRFKTEVRRMVIEKFPTWNSPRFL